MATRYAAAIRREAKERGDFINAASTRTAKSLILLDNGLVIASAMNPVTIIKRFRRAIAEAYSTVSMDMSAILKQEEKEQRDDEREEKHKFLKDYGEGHDPSDWESDIDDDEDTGDDDGGYYDDEEGDEEE